MGASLSAHLLLYPGLQTKEVGLYRWKDVYSVNINHIDYTERNRNVNQEKWMSLVLLTLQSISTYLDSEPIMPMC